MDERNKALMKEKRRNEWIKERKKIWRKEMNNEGIKESEESE